MDMLINALLQFSRLSRTHLEMTEVDCRALVESLLPDLVQSGRSIEWRILDLPGCMGDPALLRQVYANLIGNAVKYSAPRAAAIIEVGGSRSGHESTYYVKDNGVGFDMQYADRIFGVFQRLHTPDEFDGAGLGLAIVKRIVERHGGRIWCDARLGQGATFYFTIPMLQQSVVY